ncbi:SusC/RagA family TonB-linked outer membrane protein [Flavitalea sp.]|nr:TonB-dependent receptor [Flavitalea sp.]
MSFTQFNRRISFCIFFVILSVGSITNLFSQVKQSLVKGIVSNSSSAPLSGVSVVLRNTNTNFTSGTSTDSSGTFIFSGLPAGGPYSFSFSAVGYEAQTLSGYNIREQITLSLVVQMKSTSETLNDVVVVGYGSQKRKDLTGSVSSVSAESIKDLALTRVDQALLGKVAGVHVKPSSGEPGSPPQIRIRGVGSISAGSDPLYVVDGVPMASIQAINPNDIENIDVLKDASATAIYGSRGSNGVIIVNTKRGKSGKAVFGFDTYFGFQKIAKVPEYQTAMEEAQHYLDGIRNRNIDENNPVTGYPTTWIQAVPITIMEILEGKIPTNPGTTNIFTNHLDEVTQTAPMQQYQLTARGGTENVKYALGGEYLNQDGIIINTNYKRYSARANIDVKVSKRMALKMNFNPSYTDKTNIGGPSVDEIGSNGGRGSDIIYNAIQIPQYYSLTNPDGSYFPFGDGLDAVVSTQNPLALAREVIGRQKQTGFLGNISAEYAFTPALKLNVLLGVNMMNIKGMRFKPMLPAFNNNPAIGIDNASMLLNWLTETTVSYNKIFGKHSISGLAGFTSQEETFESNIISSDKFPNNLVPTLSAVSGIITSGSSDIYEWSLLSYLGRINYNYDGKYYVTASIRTDGSSRFGGDNKYGIFPSAALAWRISDEIFMERFTFIDDLKFRVSYGETGNNNIGNYDQYATVNYDKYTLGGTAIGGYAPGRLANPSLTWEKQKSFNGGIDLRILKGRIGFTVDHFQSNNYDLLLNVNVPAMLGFNTALKNIGEVKNTGWEFVLNTINTDGKFKWTTDFNLSTIRGEVIKLGPSGDPIINGGNITMIGQPVGMFFGWVGDGIFNNQAELANGPIFNPGARDASRVGDVRFKDISGPDGKPDGIINSLDKTIIGSPYPDFYYGMTNNFSYKNMSLSVSLQGTKGNEVLALERSQSTNNRARFRQLSIMNNYWKSETETGNGWAPRPNDTPTGNWRGEYSTLWLDNASYLRINNITFSYVFPPGIITKAKINSARVYVTANNPFLVTDYIGFNPDVSRSNNPLTPGVSNYDYPMQKSIVFGLNLTF